MKLSKVALAVTGTLLAASFAQAGQIDSSSTTLAREVITSNAAKYRAPSKSYTFAGQVSAATNEQRMQLQWQLSVAGPTWAGVPAAFTAPAPEAAPGGASDNYILRASWKNAANVTQYGFPTGTTIAPFITTLGGRSVLAFNVTIPAAAANVLNGLVVTINPIANPAIGTPTVNSELTGLFTVAGATSQGAAPTCPTGLTTLDVNFKHYTNHDGNLSLQSFVSSDSEHVRNGSTNDGRMLNFVENLRFAYTAEALPITAPSNTGQTVFATGATTGANSTTQARLGTIRLATNANGLDLNYSNLYGAFDPVQINAAADFSVLVSPALAVATAGAVELYSATLAVNASAGYATGSTVGLYTTAACAVLIGALSPVTAAGATTATITLTTDVALLALANATAPTICVNVTGTAIIPNSAFTVVSTLVKANGSTTGATQFTNEQNNSCTGTLASVGNRGAQIDIRNYASFASFGAAGPQSVVRIINNSEVKSADVTAQMIYADGTYGPWGTLQTLKPREVMNYTNQQLEALMTNAAPAARPSNFVATTSYTQTAGTAVVTTPKLGVAGQKLGDRVRFSTIAGETLRVQSFMFVNGQILDTSNAQGVDFEVSATRFGSIDQANSQDAINPIAK